MKDKKSARLKRSKRTRKHIAKLDIPRLSVHRTLKHIYAQVLSAGGDKVIASFSTKSKDAKVKQGGNVEAAKAVGAKIAELSIASGVKKVAFDRSGFKYHGRIKALADAAREAGLEF